MLLSILRAVFVLMITAVGMNYAENHQELALPTLVLALGVACLVIAIDIFIPQKSLLAISGLFFGLVTGMLIAYGLGLVLDMVVRAYSPSWANDALVTTTKLLIGLIACYFCVSFILQTKDDVRFVIPYVEFSKQRKGQHPLLLDTSVLIDGRIVDVLAALKPDVPILIPRFVLQELQAIADSPDKLRRNRGRRGLDIVNRLQNTPKLDVQFHDAPPPRGESGEDDVDHKLVNLARQIDARIVTNDYNLNKVATIRGVDVININDLANAVKPVFLPGETLRVKVIRPGEGPAQGVGYLEDGTMVVVEAGREAIGQTVTVTVTSALQTSAGRMVFGRLESSPGPEKPPRRPEGDRPERK